MQVSRLQTHNATVKQSLFTRRSQQKHLVTQLAGAQEQRKSATHDGIQLAAQVQMLRKTVQVLVLCFWHAEACWKCVHCCH